MENKNERKSLIPPEAMLQAAELASVDQRKIMHPRSFNNLIAVHLLENGVTFYSCSKTGKPKPDEVDVKGKIIDSLKHKDELWQEAIKVALTKLRSDLVFEAKMSPDDVEDYLSCFYDLLDNK